MKKLSILFLLGFQSLLFADKTVTPPATFGGGLNIKTAPSDIGEDESPDMANMINDLYGASLKRNGSYPFNTVPISSEPITTLKRVYGSTEASTVYKTLLIASGKHVYATSSTLKENFVKIATFTHSNQYFTFAQRNPQSVLLTGDKLTTDILSYNVVTATANQVFIDNISTGNIVLRAKYLLQERGYTFYANVLVSTKTTFDAFASTFYPNRVYYSLLTIPTSVQFDNYFETDDEITGLGNMDGVVSIFQRGKVNDITFSVLDPDPQIGDQEFNLRASGFGCIAPRTLVNVGPFYIFLAADGIRALEGGLGAQLSLNEKSKILSTKIEPIITEMVRAGTYKNSHAVYYPKKQWYVFAYEDPKLFPKGKPNSVLILDLVTGNWFPFKNWIADSFTVFDGEKDNGELLYGEAVNGRVHFADSDISANDSRRELVIATMDSTATGNTVLWTRGTTDYVNVLEGTGSIRMRLSALVTQSSVSYMSVLNLGEWPDKKKTTKDDRLFFRAYASSLGNVSSLRVDLEMEDITGDFNHQFSSVTVGSAAFTGGNNAWTTFEIPLSSFPILSTWTALGVETLPFANAYTFYGIRFVAVGNADESQVSIDDLRLVGATESPLNSYRYTKQFNLGTPTNKDFRNVVLNAEAPTNGGFSIDVFGDFGQFAKRIDVNGPFTNDLFIGGYQGLEGVAKINSNTFSIKDSTLTLDRQHFAIRPLTTDGSFVYGGDQYNNRIIKIGRSSMTVILSTIGSLGSGATNFNGIYQIAADDNFLFICDFLNNRLKVHRVSDLGYTASIGSLGSGATSFHNPTGVAVDDRYVYVAQDGNYRIQKFLKSEVIKSSGYYVTSIDLNLNTIGDISLAVDEQYLYCTYNSISETSVEYLDVILEKRNKSDLSLLNKVTIRPRGVSTVSLSTYALQGDITLSDDYIFIPFTDDVNGNGLFYIQKLLKRDFSLITQYTSTRRHFALSHNGISYKPKRRTIERELGINSAYLQFRYFEEGLDNPLKLYNQSFKILPQEVR